MEWLVGLVEALIAGLPAWFRGFLLVFLPTLAILGPHSPALLREIRQWRADAHHREMHRRRLLGSPPPPRGTDNGFPDRDEPGRDNEEDQKER